MDVCSVIYTGHKPSNSLVLKDLDALQGKIIPYSEVLSNYANKDLAVDAVHGLLQKSVLTQDWTEGDMVIALFDLSPTSSGMELAGLSLLDMASIHLGPGSQLVDWKFAYGSKHNHTGDEAFFSSCIVPVGYFTDIHADGTALAQLIIHHEGEKIWLTWPATTENLQWFDHRFPSGAVGHVLAMEALHKLKGLQVIHATSPCCFVLPPFTFHCVITMKTSTHSGVYFAHKKHWSTAHNGLEFARDVFPKEKFGAFKAGELIGTFLQELRFWKKAKWDESTHRYLEEWEKEMSELAKKINKMETASA
jgi:hypothetical protein